MATAQKVKIVEPGNVKFLTGPKIFPSEFADEDPWVQEAADPWKHGQSGKSSSASSLRIGTTSNPTTGTASMPERRNPGETLLQKFRRENEEMDRKRNERQKTHDVDTERKPIEISISTPTAATPTATGSTGGRSMPTCMTSADFALHDAAVCRNSQCTVLPR